MAQWCAIATAYATSAQGNSDGAEYAVEKGGFDLIHLEAADLTALEVAAYFTGVPIVLTVPEHAEVLSLAALEIADVIVCESESQRRRVLRENVAANKVVVCPSGRLIVGSNAPALEGLSRQTISSFGPVSAEFGQLQLIDALAKVKKVHPTISALIVDESVQHVAEYHAEVRRRLVKLRLSGAVSIEPGGSDRSVQMSGTEIVVFGSADRPMCRALNQAMELNRFVLGPECKWFSEEIGTYAAAGMYGLGDADDLASRLVSAVSVRCERSTPCLPAAWSSRCNTTIQIEDVYHNLFASRSPRRQLRRQEASATVCGQELAAGDG